MCSFQPRVFEVSRVREVSFSFYLPLTGYCCPPLINEEWTDVYYSEIIGLVLTSSQDGVVV